MLQPFPQADATKIDTEATTSIEWLKGIIGAIRNIRSELNVPPSKKVPALIAQANDTDLALLAEHKALLVTLAKLESINVLAAGEEAPMAASQLSGHLEVLLPMADLIDKDAEKARINREITKLTTDSQKLESKLSNANFVDKAPAAVVEKERQKLTDMQTAVEQLQEQLERIDRMK